MLLLCTALAGMSLACSRGVAENRTAIRVDVRALPEGKPTLRGFVSERATGQPIAQAVAVLRCDCLEAEKEVASDEDGRFAVASLPAGQYELTILYGVGRQYRRRFKLRDGQQVGVTLAVPPAGMPRLIP